MNKIASPILSNIFLLCCFILSGFMLISVFQKLKNRSDFSQSCTKAAG